MKAILPESVVILLVEDRTDDVELVRRGLLKAKVFNPLQVVSDGEEALAYLDGVGKYADRKLYPLPDIILLDLKMPKMDGFEVLREVREEGWGEEVAFRTRAVRRAGRRLTNSKPRLPENKAQDGSGSV